MGAHDYPRRPKFFAHQFTRLLFRVCAAQDIGTEAVALLVCIVHTEDAKRYRAPVTFWNHQLESICAMSWGRLDRARTKAIDAGWLHYEAGGKGKVGKYWVTIPAEYTEMDDNPFDEDVVSLSNCTSKMVKEPGDNRGTTGGEPRENRGTSADHSSLTLSPNPVPIHTRVFSKETFAEFWKVYPRKTGKKAAERAWRSAIKDTDPDIIVAAAAEYARSDVGRSEFAKHPATWLNAGCYEDDPDEWVARDRDTVAAKKAQRDADARRRRQQEQQRELAEMAKIRAERQNRTRGGPQKLHVQLPDGAG